MTINWKGKRRWIALAMLLAGFAVMLWAPPVIPVIQLPGEVYPGRDILGLPITNTLVSSVVVWIILALLTIYVTRNAPKSGGEVPRGGFYNFFEMIFEGLYNFISGIAAGPHFGTIFRMFMTIFLIVLFSNWQALVPGVDSIGFLHEHVETEIVVDENGVEHEVTVPGKGHDVYNAGGNIWVLNGKCVFISPEEEAELDAQAVENAEVAADEAREAALHAPAAGGAEAGHEGDETLAAADPEAARQEVLNAREAEKQARRDNGCVSGIGAPPADDHAEADAEHADAGTEVAAAPEAEDTAADDHADDTGHHFTPGDPSVPWAIVPFVRPASTDLNMTLALALAAVVMTQAIGFRALGFGYLGKFFNFRTLFNSPLGGIDVAVGLLELIGEFARLLSFAFRLLGNVFAGSVLLFVMSFLVPFLPWPFFILEFGVGMIQALVFGLLTAIFMNLATIGHHHEEEHAEEGH